MFRQLLLVLFLFVSLFVSGQQLVTQNGGHCYTLDVPEYMVKTYELNDVATLQYQNASREAYVIVIEDPKDQLEDLGMHFISASDFISSFITDYKSESESRTATELTAFDEGPNHLAQAMISWNEGEDAFYMLVTAVETETHFYKILCWSVNEHWEELKADYYRLSRTLKD
ncbi:MAG: hypothetical protein H6561_11635 [Lewinellaceae bacterium]|nr:hypothetical protein [Saprospiraceae bacterium]MCB9270209.1 hypothetical protein [Lewinellaceae bacterium]HPG08656.1 hypothetical protein [Saprospiraceae bacterium]